MHEQVMPPRDVWDCNAIFQPDFYWSYCELMYRHRNLLGFYPSNLIDEAEWSEDSDEDSDESESDNSYEESNSSMSTEVESIPDDEDSEDGMSIDTDDYNDFMDIIHLISGSGDESDPFDLTHE